MKSTTNYFSVKINRIMDYVRERIKIRNIWGVVVCNLKCSKIWGYFTRKIVV